MKKTSLERRKHIVSSLARTTDVANVLIGEISTVRVRCASAQASLNLVCSSGSCSHPRLFPMWKIGLYLH